MPCKHSPPPSLSVSLSHTHIACVYPRALTNVSISANALIAIESKHTHVHAQHFRAPVPLHKQYYTGPVRQFHRTIN